MATMEWTRQQDEALKAVARWLRERERPCFKLAGYAGTGKTTLARHFAEGFSGDVYFVAYTGKAASVLKSRGVKNATTIHRLIYVPKEKCDGHLRELRLQKVRLEKKVPRPVVELAMIDAQIVAEQQNLSRPDFHLNLDSPLNSASLVVVDEYSMVDQQVGADLCSFRCPVLALGDPGQLPPVSGRCYFEGEPDFLLTEVHRQAADDPILRLATMAREGRSIPVGTYGQSRVVRRAPGWGGDVLDVMLGADQVLVGTNKTRRACNSLLRGLRGHKSSLPEVADKLVCLRNNYEDGMLNGQTYRVTHVNVREYLELVLRGDEGEVVRCRAHKKYFQEGSVEFDPGERRLANELDFGYVLTVHKAQGSEWDRVALVDEWMGSGRREWLYTAITRAAESVTIYV
jgi:exodeoxyribonuclease-5